MLNFKSPKRIANKILLLVLVLELASICLWGSLTYSASRQEILNTISSKLNEATYRISGEMGNFFMPIFIEMEVLSSALSSDLISELQKKVLFNRLLNSRPEVEEVSFINRTGIEQYRFSRLTAYGEGDNRQLDNQDFIKQATAGNRAMSSIRFSEYAEPQVLIAVPLKTQANSENSGVLLTVVNLKWLWDSVQDQRIGRTGYSYVVNENLTLVAHRDPSLVLAKTNLQSSTVPSSMFESKKLQNLLIYTSLDNKKVAGVSLFDAKHNWWIVVEQPVEEGLAPLSRVINRFVFALLMAASITVFIVLFFSRITMRPLEKLALAIARMTDGEKNVRIEEQGHSELSLIAKGFNVMAETLDQQIQSLVSSQNSLTASQISLEEKSHILECAQRIAHIGSWERNLLTGGITWSDEIFRILGYEPGIFVPKYNSIIDRIIPSDQKRILALVEYAIANEDFYSCEYRIKVSNGTTKVVHEQAEIYRDRNGSAIRILGSLHDITERYGYIELLEYQSTHDSLTHLPNRLLLQKELHKTLEGLNAENEKFALLIFDLDRFKEVNDTLGHKSGDLLLKQIGPRILPLVSEHDVVARLGGDEFAILLKNISDSTLAEQVAEKIFQAIQTEFSLENIRVQVGVSIGIAVCPDHCSDVSTVMRFADIAMYHAKRKGIKYSVYHRDLDTQNPRRLTLMGGLREAIRDGELVLHYQPKICTNTNAVVSVEALVRWQHPIYGLIYPDQFVQSSELSELVRPLTNWVVEKAIGDCKQWHQSNYYLDIAVNLSARMLQDLDFVTFLKNCLAKQKLDPKFLLLEITESAIMTDAARAREVINQLGKMNIALAIDDYGTGYSSLSYLKQIPVKELKIDKSFITNMYNDDNDAVIVRSTIDLAHNLGLIVTAEGVENDQIVELLTILRCDYMQGFHLAEPMPHEKLMDWLQERIDSTQLIENAI